jgi:hypothetical protein
MRKLLAASASLSVDDARDRIEADHGKMDYCLLCFFMLAFHSNEAV